MRTRDPELDERRMALALGAGGARGLAHIGALEVLERERIRPSFVAGSSMGAMIGALFAAGLSAKEVAKVARGFRFPRWFVPGGLLEWDRIFGSARQVLSKVSFEGLKIPLAVTAVDLESGQQVILHTGPVLPAVQAACAVPAVLSPVELDGHWLVDGGLVNVLPVDVAWMGEPQFVVAVKVGASRRRSMPQLRRRSNSILQRLARLVPNPATAWLSFEVLVRAAEIALDRQTTLAAAMTGPELLIEADIGDIALRDFDRLDEAMECGRRAGEAALPELRRLLAAPESTSASNRNVSLVFDPVCEMVVCPTRARAILEDGSQTYYFCSINCRDAFVRSPLRHRDSPERSREMRGGGAS